MTKQIEAIWNSKSPESLSLDYKAQMYAFTDPGRKEFAKDAAGFANKDGGIIIIGIKDRAGNPEEVVGIEKDSVDSAILWLESVLRSGVSPHIVNARIQAVPLDGKTVIAVEIPRGQQPLYEVPSAGQRFFIREERSVRAMSIEEIQFAVRRDADTRARIQQFCENSWRAFIGGADSSGDQLLPDQHGCLLTVFPVFDRSFEYRFDLPTVKERRQNVKSFDSRSHLFGRPSMDGIRYENSNELSAGILKWAHIYRHGCVQYADGYILNFKASDTQNIVYPGLLLMTGILESIRTGIAISHDITGAADFLIDFRLRTKRGTRIVFYNDTFFTGGSDGQASKGNMVFDKIFISISDDWGSQITSLSKPLLDQVWQAFGFDACGYFAGDGSYRPPR